jgi:hypothetical protein
VRKIRRDEPVVTTSMFTPAEQAAWQVAVERGLPIEAADLRALLNAARRAEDEQANWG